MNKVSIVIPVYNCEKYIERCIRSILNQTYKDFEIIVIDDGSIDETGPIVKKICKEDKRIKYIHQKNSGPSIARNRGMDEATGEYIMFIDSDDYIDDDYVEDYVSSIENTDYDVVMGGYTKTKDEKVDFIRKLDDKPFSKYLVPAAYAEIYKLKFLRKNKIYFLDTKASEDVFFNMTIIKNNAKIKCIPNIGYYYYFNSESISNTLHKGFNEKVDVLDLVDKINYKKINDKELHQYFIIRYLIWYLLYSGKGASSEVFYKHYLEYFEWLDKNISSFRKNKNIRIFGPSGEVKKIGFIIYSFMILDKLKLVKLFSKFYCKG